MRNTCVLRARNLTLSLSFYIPPRHSLSISTWYYVCARTASPIIITVTIEISRRSADNNNDNKLLYYYLQRSVHRVVDVIQVSQRPAAQYLYIYLSICIPWCLTRVEPVHSQGHNVLCHFHIASPVIWVNSNRFQGSRVFRNSIFV